MDALAVSIQQADMSSLTDIPDGERASLLPAAGSSEAKKEPVWERAEVERTKKKPIPCMIPMRKPKDGKVVACRDKTFTHWAGLKKHHIDFHEKKHWPKWVKGRPVHREAPDGPNLYAGYEEDLGPTVACRCIPILLL